MKNITAKSIHQATKAVVIEPKAKFPCLNVDRRTLGVLYRYNGKDKHLRKVWKGGLLRSYNEVPPPNFKFVRYVY